MKGSVIHQYTFIKKLGDGGLSSVWLTEKLGAFYAVKINDDSDTSEYEHEIMTSVCHPHIAKIIDMFEYEDKHYIVMPLYGKNVWDMVMTEKMVRNLYYHMRSAINYLHSKGYIHNDIKPNNIVTTYIPYSLRKIIRSYCEEHDIDVPSFSNTHSFILIDFNYASEEGVYYSSTYSYRSPEMIFGLSLHKQSDYWMLGVTLYDIITEECMFDVSKNYQHIQKIRSYIGEFNVKQFTKTKTYKNACKRITSPVERINKLRFVFDDYMKDVITNLLQINPNDRVMI
jgi:serine/threonine protein kinase